MTMTGKMGMVGTIPILKYSSNNPEAEKYGKLWGLEGGEYRKNSIGEKIAAAFVHQARFKNKPRTRVIDFGCGSGRGALMIAILGRCRVLMLDFVSNCLDEDVAKACTSQYAWWCKECGQRTLKDDVRVKLPESSEGKPVQACPNCGEVKKFQKEYNLVFKKHDLEKPIPFHEVYGYCTDVMEHIPPDKVDRVLDHILKAAQHVFFSISTQEDNCGELIGETLHLTIESYGWWLKKFAERDAVIHWSQELPGCAFFYLSAWRTGKEISKSGVLNTAEQEIIENVRANVNAGWRQIVPHQLSRGLEVMILGGGPSMKEFEDEIRKRKEGGMRIITLNGAYHWAIEKGLGPVTQIMVDAREFNKRFTHPVDEGSQFLLASQVHPTVLEGLPHEKTWLFHTNTELVRGVLDECYGAEAWYPVPGGSTVLLRAIPLMRMLGFTKFILYGCDSCVQMKEGVACDRCGQGFNFETEEYQESLDEWLAKGVDCPKCKEGKLQVSGEVPVHHAYKQKENDNAVVVPVTLNPSGRVFYCNPWMVSQAQEMISLIRVMGDEFELLIRGDGVLQHILVTGAELASLDVEEGKEEKPVAITEGG